MKKPTFSGIFHWILFFFEKCCRKNSNLSSLVMQELRSLKKSFFQKNLFIANRCGTTFLLTIFFFLTTISVFSQLAVPFTPRLSGGNIKVKGDVILIGNSIIAGKGLTNPYNGTGDNNSNEGAYINIDKSTPGIFSSSSADLKINNSCKKIIFAGLYWASIYPNEVGTDSGQNFVGTPRLTDWNQIKFKVPNGNYVDLVASKTDPKEVIFDGYNYTNINNSFKDSPIICFKDVTSLLSNLTDADGTYVVANQRATTGKRNGGCAAGWTLVVIYESPTLPSKFISIFDGYAGVQSTATLNIPVSGFKTLPSPFPVNAKIGVSALEGDLGITGDSFQFKAASKPTFAVISDALSAANNFFNSRVTNNGTYMTGGNPSSNNKLGYDIKNVIIPNPSWNTLPNNETAGDLKLTTNGDGYGAFVTSFAVDIIEPKILLTKIVKDDLGNDASSQNVTLGQGLNYTIGFENQGNDDATSFTIKDVLPINVNFNYPSDIVSLPAGVTHTYNAATRTIIFTIPDNLVSKALVPGGPFRHYDIVFKVKVVPTCNELSDACENRIQNSAYATYKGVINQNQITDDPSLSSYTSCNLGTPQATNFLVGVQDCLFTKNVVLCGSSALVTASNGYASYNWTGPGNFTATGQTVTITTPGVYRVFGVGNRPCTDYNEEITVVPFGGIVNNPVIPFADQVVTCPNDGKKMPNIFLCGGNASRLINTNISDGSTIVWEKLNEASCSAVVNSNCANESSACSWTSAGANGSTFLANTSGQFRVTFNYPGGCFNRFYFNVYQNLLNPSVTTNDIICNTKGSITVGDVPPGYEYSLDGVTYQASNVFPINTPNTYTVYIRQIGVVSNPCIFTVPNILIRQRVFTVTTINTNPLCNGGKGTVELVANDVRDQYSFEIYQGATLVNSSGLVASNNFVFSNLNAGTYTVKVTTQDGCSYSGPVTIVNPPLLTATASLTTPLTCADGEILVNPVGGTSPYYYYVNSTTVFQTEPQIPVTLPLPAGGIFNIKVVDSQNCSVNTSITVVDNPKPVYTVTQTDIKCYGDNTGTIQFNVGNANGYTLAYSIDNGVTYTASPVFSNLVAGTYNVILRYTFGTSVCYDTMRVITIAQPSTALTASAGVSELAGCGPSGDDGKIRITNPQGGVAPYQYSFDNQTTWITTNEAYKAPGIYTVYIKDANGCIYAMPNIVIDPKPVAPTIDLADPVFNCNGTANSTVTVTNPSSATFSYDYLLDGVVNTNVPSNIFVNVPSGMHTISVSYKPIITPTYSNLLKEDFGNDTFSYTATASPDASSPGINSAFCWERQVDATKCNGDKLFGNGEYTVTSSLRNNPYSGWHNPIDHTAGSARGRYLAVDAGSAIPNNAVLYRKTIKDIIPNQSIQVRFFATNLLKVGNTQPDASLTVELQNSSGTPLSSSSTGGIPKTNGWVEYNQTINPGNNTTLDFVLRLEVAQVDGIDFAVDDLEVYQLPKSCATQANFPFVVPTGRAFTGSVIGFKDITCAGANNGEITLTAANFDPTYGFDYSIDGGTTWVNSPTSPVTITGLAANTYTPLLRYNAAGACPVTLTPVTIKNPTPIVADVLVTNPATCTTGATITANASGGTPSYQYELRQSDGLSVVTAFNNNRVFTNVPVGNYTVFVRDANMCISNTVGVPVNVVAPPAITATLDASTDLCYTSANPATLVVNVMGGVGPFTYKLDANAAQNNNNTFNNVGIGTHSILITDSNNCTATISNIIIASQLLPVARVTKVLDCSSSPDAIITVNIVGGVSPFTYTVQKGSGTPSAASSPSADLSFTYSVSNTNADIYTFVVTDANGCSVTTRTTVNPLVPVSVTMANVEPSCSGVTDGSIKLIPSGGVGPYQYSIDNGATPFVTTNVFGGLSAGTYQYIIKDRNGCEARGNVILQDPAPITPNIVMHPIVCNVNSPGSFDVSVTSGGVAPFTYKLYDSSYNLLATYIETGASPTGVHNFGGLTFGDYYITIVDAKGCQFSSARQRITTPPFLEIDAVTLGGDCIVGATVDLKIIAGGVPPYRYSIYGQPSTESPAIPDTTYTFPALLHGTTYYFEVKDSNNCSSILEVAIPSISDVKVVIDNKTDVTCNGSNNGIINYTVSDFDSSVTTIEYELLNPLTNLPISPAVSGIITGTAGGPISGTISGLKPGDYVLKAKEATGTLCAALIPFTISQPIEPLTASVMGETNANCGVGTQITVSATGGTGPYQYAFVLDSAPHGTAYRPSNVGVLDYASGTDWDIWVKDSKGCEFKIDKTITKDPEPVVAGVLNAQCGIVEGNFAIDVTVPTVGIPPYSFSIDGSGFQTHTIPFTISNLSSGTHTIEIKDANGCGNLVSVPILAPLVLTPSVTTLPSCANNDGVVIVSATGGSSNYEYNIDGGTFGTATTFNTVTTGPHTMGVRDTTTGCEVSVPITLSAATPITGFVLSQTPVTCNGGNDGTITAIMTTPAPGINDNPVYMYSLNGGTPQASNIFMGLTTGIYTVDVVSGRGCTDTANITVGTPPVISVPAPTVVPFACASGNTSNFAIITVNGVTGGSGTYTIYEFSKGGTVVQRGASNVYTETNLAGGTYTVNVYDDKGCIGSTSVPITITPFMAIDKINTVVNQAINCRDNENITVTAVDASGTAITGIEYSLVDVSGANVFTPNTTGIFPGLTVGNYIITATNTGTGCSVQDVHYVNQSNTFDFTIDNVVDVSCFGGTNGSANVTIIDKTITPTNPNQAGAFDYTLVVPNGTPITGNSPVAGPLALTGLVAGTYTITATLTNNPFCSVSKSFTISQPTAALKISETHTPITCVTGNNDGTISASAVGGWPGGYEFQLELVSGTVVTPWSSVPDFTGLTVGNYIVKVRDNKGCMDQITVDLVNPTPITAVLIVDKPMLACFGDTNATLTVQQPVTGGSDIYKYTLETTYPDGTVTLNGPQISNVFINLGAGSYRVIVSDTWDCSSATNTVVIGQPTVVTASLVKTTAQTCSSPATLTLSAAGGTGPYTYSADSNFATVLGSFATSTTVSVPLTSTAVNYIYYVKDSNGCTDSSSNTITIAPLEPLEFKFENDNPYINCFGDNSGQITAIAKGGSGNYIYNLLDSSGNAIMPTPVQLTPGHFTQLVAGNYLVEVISGDCTTARKPITIIQPNVPLTYTAAVTDVTCNGNGDGKLVLTASGGTGVIKYALSPNLNKFVDAGTFINLPVGSYQAIIQDVRGCNFIYNFEIKEPNPIDAKVDPLTIQQELCVGEKTGAFNITISGGVAPYSTSIDGDAFVPNRVSFTGLSGGNHTVIVKDANSCEFILDVALDKAVVLEPVTIISNDCVNNAPANKVTVYIDESNNPADVMYSLDSTGIQQNSNVFTNLTPGSHFIMVHHKNGCIDATDPFTIDKVDPLTISLDLGGLNEIVATATGGSGVYQYSVNGESIGSDNKYIYFKSGDYTVTVTDSNGCSVSATKYFEFIDIKIPPIFTPTGDGTNDTWKPTNTENYPDIKFVVYDRYGRQVGVFGAGQSWDGKYNGTELPMGDYWYVLKLRHSQDDREFIGHFTLYR